MPSDTNYTRYIFEFLSIFIAVISAFALANWSENNRNQNAADKILKEIRNGLHQDLEDMEVNIGGHKISIRACQVFRDALNNKAIPQDSIGAFYISAFRDYLPIMNMSAYESLKARGLELIKNDSLRLNVISLYDFQYEIIEKIEKDAPEMQFFMSYYEEFGRLISPHLVFDDRGNLIKLEQPITLSKAEKNRMLDYLWRIQVNRNFKVLRYEQTKEKVNDLIEFIDEEVGITS